MEVPATCYPIVGSMTVWISSSVEQRRRRLQQDDAGQEAALYDIIQSYIEQNQDSFLSDELLHVAYIGHGADTNKLATSNPIHINANKDVGMSAGLIGVTVSAVVLAVFLAFGFALAYRRRRQNGEGRRQQARTGLDLERGAFPVRAVEEDDTQDALASQDTKDDNNRYNSLFGLTGSRSDDSSIFENVLMSPSSCTTIGVANTVPRQFFPSSPTNSSQAAQEVSSIPRNTEESFDMAPLSPMNKSTGHEAEDGESHSSSADDSSVMEVIDDDNSDEVVAPVTILSSPRDIGNAQMQGSMIV